MPERQLPIVVKLRDDARQDQELLSRLVVPGARGMSALIDLVVRKK